MMNTVQDLAEIEKVRIPSISENALILSDIYNECCNLAIWQRQLDTHFLSQVQAFIRGGGQLNLSKQIGLATAKQDLSGLGSEEPFAEKLLDYIGELVDMFCCLFDANTLGFRISTMDRAMCPRFHVDRVPCRLVTAFYGSGSQYLPFEQGEQNKRFVNDPSSDLHIQTLSTGDVALMKGELWEGNQNAGLIHRSPPVSPGEKRIVMTLDLVD